MLKNMFAEVGENCYIEPPLHTNWGGRHVHFGSNVYANIGAGSVVTKDIPANVVAVGNPYRVLRPISEHDREVYFKNRQIPAEFFEK